LEAVMVNDLSDSHVFVPKLILMSKMWNIFVKCWFYLYGLLHWLLQWT